jgi:Mg2+ and Co2+ transporter CorA
MKYYSQFLFIALVTLAACGKSSEHANHEGDDQTTEDSPNQALYDQVMDIHNEVMPMKEDLYKLKKELEEKIVKTPSMAADKRQELKKMIAELDSADNAMMDWMHNFNPLPDSADEEKAREYLETEMERIKKVRDLTNEAIERAKPVIGNR